MGNPIQGDPTSTLNVESRRLDVSESASPKMSRTQAIVLGVVEGVTEYLPVSSTGHLLLAQRWMGIGRGEGVADKEAADAYAVCIQAGAILAVLGLFYGRIAGIARGVFGADRDGLRLGINLAVAFAPAAVVGMLLANTIKGWLFGDGRWGLWPIVGAWFVGGVVILVYAPHARGARPSRLVGAALEALTWRGALVIGAIQCLGMWPGVSRSLATILGGLLVGLGLSAAVEFSFLLGLITLSASTLVDALKYGPAIVAHYGPVTPLLGLVVAMLSAALAVKWMVGYLQRHGLALFGWYRLVLAFMVAAWIVM